MRQYVEGDELKKKKRKKVRDITPMATNMDRPADIAGTLRLTLTSPVFPKLALLQRLCRCRRTLLEAVAGSNIAAIRRACGPKRNQEIPWPAVAGICHAKVKFCTCMDPGTVLVRSPPPLLLASGIGRLYSYLHVLVLDGPAGDAKVTNLL